MKIGEIIEVEGVKLITQKEIHGCKTCYFDTKTIDYCNNLDCKTNDCIIFVKIPLELLEKIEQLENQIQQMRNCDNCDNSVMEEEGFYCCESYIGCIKNSKWELKK